MRFLSDYKLKLIFQNIFSIVEALLCLEILYMAQVLVNNEFLISMLKKIHENSNFMLEEISILHIPYPFIHIKNY